MTTQGGREGGAAVYRFVVDLVGRRLPPGGTVLELGCGAMQYAPFLEGRYIGLDLPDSLHVREAPHLLGSAERIDLPDASVDVVFGVATFHLMRVIDGALREARRVLRPGGYLLVFDYQQPVLERFAAVPDYGFCNVWTSRQLRERVARAGFPRRRIRDLSHRAHADGDPPPSLRPALLLKRRLRPGQWLVLEAVRGR